MSHAPIQHQIRLVRQRCTYIEQKGADPFSTRFKVTAIEACTLTTPEIVAQYLPNWWLSRFNVAIGTIPAIDMPVLRQWCMHPKPPVRDFRNADIGTMLKLYAWQFAAEVNTLQWLLEQNAKGIAVPSHELWQHYTRQWPVPDARTFHTIHTLCWAKPCFKPAWLGLFRARWGIAWKRLPPANPAAPDDTRRKVHFIQPKNLKQQQLFSSGF